MNTTIQTVTIRENQFSSSSSDRQACEHTWISLVAFWPHRRFLLAQQDSGEALQCVCSSLCEVYAKTGAYVQFVYKFLSREMCIHWFRHNYGLTLSSHGCAGARKKVSVLFIFKNGGAAVRCSIALCVLCSFICCSASKKSISEFQELGSSGDVPNTLCSFHVHLLRIMQIDWLSRFGVVAPIVSAQYATSSPKQNVQPVTFSLHGFLDSIKL